MDWSANYAGFVMASYGLSVLVLGGLIWWIMAHDRKLRAKLAQSNPPENQS